MKKILLLIVLFCNCMFANQMNDKEEINYGFYIDSILLSNEKEVRIAIEMWIKEFIHLENINVNVKIYSDVSFMIDDFVNKKTIDIIGFNSIAYLNNKHILADSYKNMFTFSSSKDDYIQYYLIQIKKDTGKKALDIKDKTVAIKKGDLSAKLWLDTLSMNSFDTSYKKLIKEEVGLEKQSSGILKVYFKEVDFAVVSKGTWKIMHELNSALTLNIKIVKKSPAIFSSYIGMISNRVAKDVANKFIRSVKRVNDTKRGKQILSLLKVHSVIVIDESYLNELEDFLEEYNRLRKVIN